MIKHIWKYSFAAAIIVTFLAGCNKDSAANEAGFNDTGKGGSMARFAVTGNYLYTVDENNLHVFDVSEPTNPKQTNVFNTGTGIETIWPRDEKTLFIGSQIGMYIFSIENPASPQLLSTYTHVRSCDPVVADDKYAYVTLRSNRGRCGSFGDRLEVIDIQNLRNPTLVSTFNMTSPKGLGINKNTLFVCDAGIRVLDVTDPRNIFPLQHLDVEANDVIPMGNNLMVIGNDGLYQYKYENEKLTLLSKLPVTGI